MSQQNAPRQILWFAMIGLVSGVLTTAVSTALLVVLDPASVGWALPFFVLYFLTIMSLGGAAGGGLIGVIAATGLDLRRPLKGLLVGASAMAIAVLLWGTLWPEPTAQVSMVALPVGAVTGAVIAAITKIKRVSEQ